MALTKCKECKREVSTEAKACPHCGAVRTSSATMGCAVIIFGGIAVSIIAGMFGKHESASAPAPRHHDVHGAAAMCQHFVEKRLKAPSTADFPWGTPEGGLIAGKPDEYLLTSYVDAQNSFGAKIRSHYVCHVRATDSAGDHWQLINLTIR